MSGNRTSFFLKRGTLLGGGLGLLVGFFRLTVQGTDPAEEVSAIVSWRSDVLIGALVGFLGGAIIAYVFPTADETDT